MLSPALTFKILTMNIINIFLLILLVLALLFLLRLFWGFYIITQGAFYAISNTNRIKNIVKLADIKSNDKVIDLGSGDGRILIEFAKKGANCTGIELDPFYTWMSGRNIKNAGLSEKITVKQGNFWNKNLSDFDIIIFYGAQHIMNKMERKLLKEAKKDAFLNISKEKGPRRKVNFLDPGAGN
jgi:SAM-dependent methyltransferase